MSIKELPCWTKISAVVFLAVFVLNWPRDSSDWASWVQAFGTIGAIVAGFLYVNRSHKIAEHARESADRRALLNLLTQAKDSIELAVSATDDYRASVFQDDVQAADGVLLLQRKSEDYFSLLSLYKANIDRVISSDALSVKSRSALLQSINNFWRLCEAFRLHGSDGASLRDLLARLFDITFEDQYSNALDSALAEIDATIRRLRSDLSESKA